MTSFDYLSVASAIIALVAMTITVWQAYLARKHNYLTVRPLLVWNMVRQNTSEGAEIVFSIKNGGVGPALVTDRYFTVNGNRFTCTVTDTEEGMELVERVLGKAHNYSVKTYGIPKKGNAILPQEEVVVAHIVFHGMTHDTISPLIQGANNIGFCLDYESLYGQTAKLRS